MSTGLRKIVWKIQDETPHGLLFGTVWNKCFKESFYRHLYVGLHRKPNWSKGRSIAGISGSNPAGGMGVCLLCKLRPLRRADHSFTGFIPVVCVCVFVCVCARACVCVRFCDLKTSTMRRPGPVAPYKLKAESAQRMTYDIYSKKFLLLLRNVRINALYFANFLFLTVVFVPQVYAPFQNV